MSLLDFSKNCDIITHSFSDDLLNYSIKDNTLKWDDNSILQYTTKLNLFENIEQNYWVPNFITNDNLIDNKIISNYGPIKGDNVFDSGRIGIEDFVSFTPKFKNWIVANGTMVVDWILSRSRSPYSVMYGLSYWKRGSSPIRGGIAVFPLYSKIKYNNIEYIKLDNNTLRKLTVKQNVFSSNDIRFNYTEDDSDTIVSDLGDNIVFTLVGSDIPKVWIPDGDQVLYFLHLAERNKNLRANIGPRSYISGSLYKYYNIFYNSLTASEPTININSSRSIKTLRLYKKLAHALATSPFVSDFFVSFITKPSSTIKDAISTYLNSTSDTIDTDIRNLTFVLEVISREYSTYEINNNSNIVQNNNELFIKLINKYGSKLKLIDNASVTYRPSLTNGDSILIEEIGDTLVSKNTTDILITNNKKINLSNLVVETNLGEAISSILLKKKTGLNEEILNTVYLYDIVKPDVINQSSINIALEKNNNVKAEFKNDPSRIPELSDYDATNNVFYWGAGRIEDNMRDWLFYCPKLKVLNLELLIKHTDARFPNQGKELVENEFFCSWEKVSGPSLKFVDLNKTQTNKNYNKAYGNEVMIVPYSTGKYVIKCTISSPFGSYTKFKTIFIVDGREKVDNKQNDQFYTYSDISTLDILFPNNLSNDDLRIWDTILSIRKEDIRIPLNQTELGKYGSENIPIFIKNDNLQVSIAGLNSIAIHSNGLFAPIRTDYYVERISASNRSIEKLNTNYNFVFDKENTKTFVPKRSDSSLTIDYLNNNTIIKLDRIILRNIRNNTKECSQCYSLYKPKFKSFINASNRRPSFQRSHKFPDGFTLQRYINDGPNKFNKFSLETYIYPEISSDLAPNIETYGGYGNKVLNKLSINNISAHDKPDSKDNEIVANTPKTIPSVTGYKLDYTDEYVNENDTIKKYKFCYQNTVAPSGFAAFAKGTFVPNSGWVNNDDRNLSSVLKFNPGARKSFSFTGPGILGLSNYTNENNLSANIFTSTIQLAIDPSSMWWSGPKVGGPPGPGLQAQIRAATKEHNFINQINRELADQYIGGSNDYHHGYRLLNGGNPKLPERNLVQDSTPKNDEFNLSIDETNNKFSYNFTVVGPNNPINFSEQDLKFIKAEYPNIMGAQSIGGNNNLNDFMITNITSMVDEDKYIDNSTGWNLRNPRINNLRIKDIEVKLNFLNYVNTKNIAIWLEVTYGPQAAQLMSLTASSSGPSAPSQIVAPNIFKDQYISNSTHKAFTIPDGIRNSFVTSDNIPVNNISIKNYLKNLTDTNSRDSVGEKLILYLLNQETIQNKEYNFSVKFSDTANKHNTFFDHNMFSNGTVNPNQNIISNDMVINPSKNSFNYDTYNHSNFSNITKLNNLNINNNTFQKFVDRTLFLGLHPNDPSVPIFGPYTASTQFKLHIAILEEEDEMFPIDNIISNDIYTNLASVENQISSANLFNNLCSWELILHTEDVKKPVTTQVNSLANYGGADALSSLEYGEEPKYPGYSFIANLKDSKFLLPLVNMNAPTSYYQNYNSCEYADNELIGKGTLINSPRFPTEALLFILAGTAVGGMTGTLVGALVGGLGPTYSLGFQMLLDYYKASRTVPLLELTQRETFDMDYEGYPFGNSDKILLNISKDSIFWYKVEASIFKLSNTPALPLKEYSLLPRSSSLFKFEFSIISNNSDIIDDIFLPYIIAKAIPEGANQETIDIYQNINNDIYRFFDFTTVNELVYLNKLIIGDNNIQQDIFSRKRLGDALIIIDHTLPFYLIDINDRINLDCTISASRDSDSSILLGTIQVTSKALVFKDSRYQTILAVSVNPNELAPCASIILPTNVIAFADNSFSTYYNSENISPISLFGLTNNQPPYDNIPELNFSTNSLGSYGDGSSVKDKNILSRKIKVNNINSICDEINSFNNDKYYFNKITYKYLDGTTETLEATKFTAYPVYYDSNLNTIIDNKFYHLYDKTFTNIDSDLSSEKLGELLDNINTSIKNYFSYTKDQPKNLMFLKFVDQPITVGDPAEIDLKWNARSNGFLNGDPWTINNTKLNIKFEDSQNCQGSNNLTQSASATTTIIPDKNYRLEVTIEGKAELEDPGYDRLTIKLNDFIVAEAAAQGGKKLCEMGPVFVRKYEESSPLFVGQKYILSVDVTTGDPLFHKNAYYNITFKFLTPETPQIISIENDYAYNDKIHRITQAELVRLKDRLAVLSVVSNTELDSKIGIGPQTTNILNSNNIYYIQQHYDSLEEDGASCVGNNCYKQRTYNLLQKLYHEKNDILKLLENQTIRDSNNNLILDPEKQKYHTGGGGIIPDFKANIITERDGSIRIDYEKISDNYYWINIDPKQSCSIAEESRPRILKSIKYICQATNPSFSAVGVGAEILDFNNICPDWKDIDGKVGDSIKIQADSTGTTYIMYDRDFRVVELATQKNNLAPNAVWKTQTISRRFRINSDNNIKGLAPNQEFLVTAIETYDIALTQLETAIDNGRAARLTDNQIIESLLTDGIIRNDYSGDVLKRGLLNGLGEPPGDTNRDSTRNSFPTRVYNIFNLDDTKTLYVQFRKAPRALRGIDAIGAVLRYGETMGYKPQNRPPLDPLDIFGVGRTESLINNFYEWKCLQLNNNRDGIESADTPDFFKLLNEMAFRAFFGSVDEIENKTPQLKSLYDFEMIPYEYFTKPPPKDNE